MMKPRNFVFSLVTAWAASVVGLMIFALVDSRKNGQNLDSSVFFAVLLFVGWSGMVVIPAWTALALPYGLAAKRFNRLRDRRVAVPVSVILGSGAMALSMTWLPVEMKTFPVLCIIAAFAAAASSWVLVAGSHETTA